MNGIVSRWQPMSIDSLQISDFNYNDAMHSCNLVTKRWSALLVKLTIAASAISTLAGPLLPAAQAAPQAQNSKPNIIIILADDMGFSDIGCYGGEIKTPVLDQLASNGVRFTQFYNGARCCPTRAALLTGLYAHQAGLGGMEPDWGKPGYRGNISKQCVTLAEAMRPAGYSTYMAGKWHVTNVVRAKTEKDKWNWPMQRGFDRYFGTIRGAGSFFNPTSLTRDNENIEQEAKDDPNFYYTDAINKNAATFVTEHHQKTPNKPLFMYIAHTAPHWPLHARPEDVKKYRKLYEDKGWDQIRTDRFAKQKQLGLSTDAWRFSDRPSWIPAWKDLPKTELPTKAIRVEGVNNTNIQPFMANRMAIYAAMIDRMDQGIGWVVESLKETGRLDNTLILFLADNGGCAEYGIYGFASGKNPQISDEGGPKSFTSYGAGWASASNTPFRYYKHDTYEGGIATPLIAHWPKGIAKAVRGSFNHQLGHVIDLMPTLLTTVNGKYPIEHQGKNIKPLAGQSLLTSITEGKEFKRKQPLFWEHHGNRGVRSGKWKLVARGEVTPWELFDMTKDRSELDNQAKQHPDIVKRMDQAWWAWAKRSDVLPMNPNRKKKK